MQSTADLLDAAVLRYLSNEDGPRVYGQIKTAVLRELTSGFLRTFDSGRLLHDSLGCLKRAKRIVFVRKPVRGWVIA